MTDLAIRMWAPRDLEVRGDGRTLYGLAVPFDEEARVNDGRGFYTEVFRFGSFAKTIQEHSSRIKLLANHDKVRLPIGKPILLREDRAGLIGEFRVSATRDGDEALQLVQDGVLDAFSVGFMPVKDRKGSGGIVERLEVKLREVSVVAFPAYSGAAIAGVRYDLFDEESACAVLSSANRTPDLGAAFGTPLVGAAASAVEPDRHSAGPTPAERRYRLAQIQGVLTA